MNQRTIVLGLMLVFAAACSAQDMTNPATPTSCQDPRGSGGRNVCFDAVSGTFFGSRHFLRRDTVNVWVCHIDATTQYRVTIDDKSVAEPDLGPILAAKSLALELQKEVPSCVGVATIQAEPFTARTDTLTLQVQKKDDKSFTNGPGSPATLTMGQTVFGLGLGFAGTPLGKTTFQTLGGSSASGSSGSSSGGTIGYQENSSSRVQPMGFVHASLFEGRGFSPSLHLSAGFTMTDNKISTNPEFLFGPSLSFLNERLFLTGGAYGGYTSALQGAYTLGGPAPSGSIPTLNQLHWKAGFAISWRVTSFGSSNNKSSVSGQTDQTNTTPKNTNVKKGN